MQMFYTNLASNTQNRHKQRTIPSPIPTPPESLKLERMTQEIAASSLFIGGLDCWRAVLEFRDISGYYRIFHPNVLHMFYSFMMFYTRPMRK